MKEGEVMKYQYEATISVTKRISAKHNIVSFEIFTYSTMRELTRSLPWDALQEVVRIDKDGNRTRGELVDKKYWPYWSVVF